MKLMTVIALTSLQAAYSAAGADEKVPAQAEREKKGALPVEATKQTPRPARAKDSLPSTNPSFSVTETWSSFTVQPGTPYKLSSATDYTGADHIAVAIECPTGSSPQSVVITVWWGNPNAIWLTLTDVILGNGFPLKNMGGGTVPAYGPQLQLQVVNTGTAPVSCDQVTTYAVVH
jgi:hypothetical protein